MAGAVVVDGLERGGTVAEWARRAAARARTYLLERQAEEGCWHFPIEANATLDAQYVFAGRLLGRAMPEVERRLGDHLRATQREDGSWPLSFGGPGHASCSIEAYFALKLLGHAADEPAMVRARRFIRSQGGAARAEVSTRILLACFDQFPWAGVPSIPPELMLVPDRLPFSIHRMSSWARVTTVPLMILLQRPPSYRVPPGRGIEELWVEPPVWPDVRPYAHRRTRGWRDVLLAASAVSRVLDRLPARLRRRGLERALRWILERQDRNGGWGIQPAVLGSVLALRAMGYASDHPAVAGGVRALDDLVVEREGHLLVQPYVSPTWDTALTVRAMLEVGDSVDAAHVRRALRWLKRLQVRRRGDWAVLRPDLPAGGWAFESAGDWYPDVGTSAVVLTDLAMAGARDTEAFRRGLAWTLGMQSPGGGYPTFDAGSSRPAWGHTPFVDAEVMIDPPAEDVTGRLCELMGVLGMSPDHSRAGAARLFLRRAQASDGSWRGRFGVGRLYGTWSALAGLDALGASGDADLLERGCAFLRRHQNDDGGFGECCSTHDEAGGSRPGPSTASQTAWGALGLMAGEVGVTSEIDAAIAYLCDRQSADGSWPEPEFTGTGLSGHPHVRDDGYRSIFPLMALGRYLRLVSAS